ncbi:MAG: PAS domain-containing sensor histidine kinase [Bdellovibrionaceae bacterium]|nr:PAS domain-containing sensor histidine kinase [Pseudobdellovibrionaceae bacterium]
MIQPSKSDIILWVSRDPLPDAYRNLSYSSDIEWAEAQSDVQAERLLQTGRFSLIIVSTDFGVNTALDLLYLAKVHQAFSIRILRIFEPSERLAREAINRGQVSRIISQGISAADFRKCINGAIERHREKFQQLQLLKESSRQNRELEAFTNSLEQLVEERTFHIETSHKEEADKLSRERLLIRFIKELAVQRSFEDILQALRKELRKFHKLGDPILAYRFGGHKTYLMSFQGGHFSQTETLIDYPLPEKSCLNDPQLVKHFANHFGRPFIKILIFPLELKLIVQLAEGKAEAVLCFESSLAEKELNVFMEYINDRIGPLSMALDRVLLENQLSVFSYRWEKTFDSMKDPIAIVDMDYEIVRSNKKFVDNFPASPKCFESFSGKKSICQGCPASRAFIEKVPKTGQIKVMDRIYQVYSYPILAENGGRVTNVVNQYVDITESQDLYLKVLQSEKMGAIGKLAGHIAHELNNPLTGLRSLAQVLIKESTPGESLYSDLVEIEKASSRSQKIIKNLLEFSASESQPLTFISVDEIVEKTLPMLKTALRSHRLQLKLNSKNALVKVEPHLLQQVVFNLVNNACQAMKESGTLIVSSQILDDKRNMVELVISDTGPGIPIEVQSKIFEAFFTTKKEGLGTGLGLSMSKSIIERFGGRICFESEPGKGAAFFITLPIQDWTK